MSTLNGIGTRFYGFSKPDEEGNCKATLWLSFFYLPFIPLKTVIIKREVTKPHIFQYNVVRKEKIEPFEILKTYFFSWIIMPLLLAWPGIFCVREVSEKIGIPVDDSSGVGVSTTWTVIFTFSIIYFIVALLLLKSWDEKRGLPVTKNKTDVSQPS